MVFREALDEVKPRDRFTIQIYATDLDRDAIEKARQGYFPANITSEVSSERISRFFMQEETGYRIARDIREMVVFATQNIIMDPPFTRLRYQLSAAFKKALLHLGPLTVRGLKVDTKGGT
jgi:two-component system CheB/CheR fusion protein